MRLYLSSLISAIENAVIKASQSVEQQNIHRLLRYFEYANPENKDVPIDAGIASNMDLDKKLVPKMIRVQFPQEKMINGKLEASTHDVHLPLISLVSHTDVKMEKIEVKTKIDISAEEIEEDRNGVDSQLHKLGVQLTPHDSNNVTEVHMTFTNAGVPEGLQKVIQGYDKAISNQLPN
ncbi:DUF2589 domain-containing protein [Fusibacter sp. JL216-2]|uniref:DUF2589 domain-containing protein n=1 Tax=Fusibacter sp. JL216-2 TaxID=3071453 RepID=UPI003D333EB5